MSAAQKSYRWYDDVRARIDLPTFRFAYQFLSRTGRMPDDRLKLILPDFMAAYEVFKRECGMSMAMEDAPKTEFETYGQVNNGFFERDGGHIFYEVLGLTGRKPDFSAWRWRQCTLGGSKLIIFQKTIVFALSQSRFRSIIRSMNTA